MVKPDDLFMRLRKLGFSLFETEEAENVNLTLADVVKSRDLRLWEGFPVVLANAAEKGSFGYDEVKKYLKKPSDKSCLASLTTMSLALYKTLNVNFSWSDRMCKSFNAPEKNEYEKFVKLLKDDLSLKVGGYEMSCQKVKATFGSYSFQTNSKFSDLLSAREELGLEYALSQVFSPKQKELFLKKLKGEKLTKTEKEYFSRAVKKKVLALANPELHRLSQKLLE
jgi:hypothetical protein